MQHRHRTAHSRIWTILAVLLPAILLVGMAIRQDGPIERPARLLEAPVQGGQ